MSEPQADLQDCEQTLAKVVASFAGRRILVVGDVMLDEYIWGDVARISPEAPVPIVAIRRRSSVPGGAGNTAVNVASLGGAVLLASVVGDDAAGGRLRDAFQQHGLALDGMLTDNQRATTSKTRIVAHHQHVVRIDDEQLTPLSLDLEDQLLRWLDLHMSGADACILSDYAKGVVSPRLAQHFIGLHYPQVGILQAGKAGVGGIFGSGRRAHCDYCRAASLAQRGIGRADLLRQIFRHGRVIESRPQLAGSCAHTLQIIGCELRNARPHRRLALKRGEKFFEGRGAHHESRWHIDAGALQLAQAPALATHRGPVSQADIAKPTDMHGCRQDRGALAQQRHNAPSPIDPDALAVLDC